MPRLFVAAWPPPGVLDLLAGLERPAVEGLRWTRPEQWHVTLRFLGQVGDAAPVVDALATMPASPCRAVLGPAVGRFGQRVLHVPVEGLDDVAAAVVAATAGMGRSPEHRPFSGHLTLARATGRGRPRVDLRPLVGAPVSACWPAEELCLVESRLNPHGARYEVVERFALA